MNRDEKNPLTRLSNPNDDSRGQCYAPVENGAAVKEKKEHLPAGKEIPTGWVEVACDSGCDLFFKR